MCDLRNLYYRIKKNGEGTTARPQSAYISSADVRTLLGQGNSEKVTKREKNQKE